MLHNSGPYGPNEPPGNMGAPINMTQISAPMMHHNLNNLSKMSTPPPQSSAGNYNLANYQPYPHPGANIPPQISGMPNYHSPFSNLVPQPSNSLLDNSWQNGMLPMNLNIQNEQHPIPNYYEKRHENELKDVHQVKTQLNIPQVHTKAYHKHTGLDHYNNYNMYDNYKEPENLDLTTKTQEVKANRRLKIENTIKMIENILVNTTRTEEQEKDNDLISLKDLVGNECQENDVMKDIDDIEEDAMEENVEDKSMSEQSDVDDEKANDDDEKEKGEVIIKIEEMPWGEAENMQIFLSDKHGLLREDVLDSRIFDGETSISEAMEHVKNGTKTDAYYECPLCGLLLKHPKRFLIHTKWHSFGLTQDRRIELARVKMEKQKQRRDARNGKSGQTKETTDKDVIPCNDCDKVFGSKSSLKNHRQRFHPTRARNCKICQKTVYGWMALRAHVASHTSEAGYQCTDCPKRFKYPHSLAKHRDTHLEKTHGCDQCPKMFGSQALLKMHMKCHERALRGATFRCTYCGKGFFEAWNLQVHERTHRNERPFTCEICNTSFGTNSSLKRHKRVSHSTSKPHECGTCHRSFVSQIILERHERRQHGDPEDFKFVCEQCPCRYLKSKDLQKHVYKAHPKGKRKRRSKSDSD